MGGVTAAEWDELEEQQQVPYQVSSGNPPLRKVTLLQERPLVRESGKIVLKKHPSIFYGNALLLFKWASPYSPEEYQVGMARNNAGGSNRDSAAKALMSVMDSGGTDPALQEAMAPAGLLSRPKCDGYHVIYRIEIEYSEQYLAGRKNAAEE